VAEAIGLTIRKFLVTRPARRAQTISRQYADARGIEASGSHFLRDHRRAVQCVLHLARCNGRQLRLLSAEEFRRGWHALLFLFPGIHPDGALDHGQETEEVAANISISPKFETVFARRFLRSGWPVVLNAVGAEAWRRFEEGELAEEEFYCASSPHSGLTEGRTSARSIRK
jgi:DNA (cytosine-5)-methyltransferase 1